MKSSTRKILWLCLATLLSACGADENEGAELDGGSSNVAQAGAQDFAEFRAIVEAGGIPSPDVLEPLGFFAEHGMPMPPADCGQAICLHPSLAVAPRFDDSNWTMAYVTMNTAVDPSELERPPLNLVVATEPELLREGTATFGGLLDALRPEDRVTFANLRGGTAVPLDGPFTAEEAATFLTEWRALPDDGSFYAGLVGASKGLDARLSEVARRLLIVTDGDLSANDDPERIVALAEGLATGGTAIGVVGFGEDYRALVPKAIGTLGAGTYSYAADLGELSQALVVEGETALYPLATEFEVRVIPSEGYRVGRIYGAARARQRGEGVILAMPALFIGQRSGAEPAPGGSRRGGGGGLFIELRADRSLGIPANRPAFRVEAAWTDAGGPATQSHEVINALPAGNNPTGMWPSFSSPDYGKAFMVLNMFLAFDASVRFFDGGDCSRAIGVVDMMRPSVEGWLGNFDGDVDIREDHVLLQQLRANLEATCANSRSVEPRGSGMGCMFL